MLWSKRDLTRWGFNLGFGMARGLRCLGGCPASRWLGIGRNEGGLMAAQVAGLGFGQGDGTSMMDVDVVMDLDGMEDVICEGWMLKWEWEWIMNGSVDHTDRSRGLFGSNTNAIAPRVGACMSAKARVLRHNKSSQRL